MSRSSWKLISTVTAYWNYGIKCYMAF